MRGQCSDEHVFEYQASVHKLYSKDMRQWHGLELCRSKAIPLDAGFQVSCNKQHCVTQDLTAYLSTIGELMWIAFTPKPDIYHPVLKPAQRNQKLLLSYWAEGLPLVGYVDGQVMLVTDVRTHDLFSSVGRPYPLEVGKTKQYCLRYKRADTSVAFNHRDRLWKEEHPNSHQWRQY